MSAPRAPVDGTTGEPLYDVINDRGLVLLLGVSHLQACRAVEAHQAADTVDPQWQGELRIVLARRGPGILRVHTRVVPAGERLEVWCGIGRFIPSGMSVAELFAEVTPELVAAVEDAARRGAGQPPASKPVSVSMDMGAADPGLWLVVHDPAAYMADMANQLDRLQRIVERFIAAERLHGSGA